MSRSFARQPSQLRRAGYDRRRKLLSGEPPRKNIVTLLDLDDTCFPTSDFKTKVDNPDADFYSGLERMLQCFLSLGRVYLVTNANKQWVDKCLGMWSAGAQKQMRMVTIFARPGSGEFAQPAALDRWKPFCFRVIRKKEETKAHVDLMFAIGDDQYEEDALVQMAKSHFAAQPTIYLMLRLDAAVSEKVLRQWHKQLCVDAFDLSSEVDASHLCEHALVTGKLESELDSCKGAYARVRYTVT